MSDDVKDEAAENDEAEVRPDEVDSLGGLSPRQRRLAQLLAEGLAPAEIKKQIGYSSSRISILQHNPLLRAEVSRLQDKIFEDTISNRLKGMSDKALGIVDFVLSDRLGRVKVSEKADMAKWVIEKTDGKAIQKVDAGGNLLSLFYDRLDAMKSQAQISAPSEKNPDRDVIDVTPAAPPKEKDELEAWVDDFCDES